MTPAVVLKSEAVDVDGPVIVKELKSRRSCPKTKGVRQKKKNQNIMGRELRILFTWQMLPWHLQIFREHDVPPEAAEDWK